MGIWDLLCCGRRDKDGDEDDRDRESATLLNPNQDRDSVLGAESTDANYGAVEQQHSGLTEEQRDKIDKIGKEVGGYMLPISRRHPHNTPSPLVGTSRDPLPKTDTIDSTDSMDSSRPPSPSPDRPTRTTLGDEQEDGEAGVVKKSLWGGAGRPTGRSRGRGRGRGRGRAGGGGGGGSATVSRDASRGSTAE